MQSVRARVAASKDMANNAEAWAGEMLDRLSELQTAVGVLNQTVDDERARVAGLVSAQLVRIRSAIIAALP